MEEGKEIVGQERGKKREEAIVEGLKPYTYSVFCSLLFAAFNIIAMVCLEKGMSRYVLVAYGYAFATATTAILALLFERKVEGKLSLPVCLNIFLLGAIGVLGIILYYAGLESTSPTFAAAINNLVPSMTFVLAIVCRIENLNLERFSSQAKIGGTIVALGGATLMTLYEGINAKTVKRYRVPLTLTTLTSLAGTLLAAIIASIFDPKLSSWKLSLDITLVAPLYTGVMVFGIMTYIQTLIVRQRGPVFVTAFRPLTTVIVAILDLFILGEALHLGGIIGAIMIVIGLYAILWGKEVEKRKMLMDPPSNS